MNCWEILNIEATTDRKRIKSAYAKKLKVTHPDDDLKAFQELKEAFDEALAYAKNDVQAIFIETPEKYDDWPEIVIEEPVTNEPKIPFEEQVQHLYSQYEKRIDISYWQSLLVGSIDWDTNEYFAYQEYIKEFLFNYYATIPKPVIQFLFTHFSLDMASQHSYHEDMGYSFESCSDEIYNVPPFSFQMPDSLKGMAREQFLTLRYAAYKSLKQGNLVETKQIIEQANQIFKEDADLLTLEGMQLFYNRLDKLQESDGTFKRSFSCFKKAVDINPNCETARFYAILIRAKRTGELSDKRRHFLQAFEDGYVIHPDFFTGFIYYFAEDYEQSIYFWDKIPKEQLSSIKKEWTNALRQQIRISKKQGDYKTYQKQRLMLQEAKKIKGDSTKKWSWLIRLVIYLAIIGLIQGCIALMPERQYDSDEDTETSSLASEEQETGSDFRQVNGAEKRIQSALVSRFVEAYGTSDAENKKRDLIANDVAEDYQATMQRYMALPAFSDYTDSMKDSITMATIDAIYTLLTGDDGSELIIVSEGQKIIQVMGDNFEFLNTETVEEMKEQNAM
ncbi:J domain-containing protein [Listeria booriae]|uniref:J domain-containing protein n=1 Tax=Listeria booriae TaxID=1552123 RepID=UPI001629036E|nr:J domain-containing protein [Listeria booriae]MBC2104506.1 J domain-containing protein [Listeria booriae]